MSMVTQIMGAIKTAKANLGDLLIEAVLQKVTGKTYVNGTYVPTTVNVPIELVVDRFSIEERMAEGFKETDLKVSVFNNDEQTLVIDPMDKVLLDGETYGILSVDPAYVGPIKALFELKLRK